MKPVYKEFQDDMELVSEVKLQLINGRSKDNLYVISHDNDRTKRVVNQVDVNEIGFKEEGLKESVQNLFRPKGDELRSKFHQIGFSEDEASELEAKLDHGKILLVITDTN